MTFGTELVLFELRKSVYLTDCFSFVLLRALRITALNKPRQPLTVPWKFLDSAASAPA